jgi:excisionase family DNA binding protein
MNQSHLFLTIKEICSFYRLKESWVRRQIFIGNMPHHKLGRLIRFKAEDIVKWLERNPCNTTKKYDKIVDSFDASTSSLKGQE